MLWLLTIGGFASHTISDILPIFWGKDLAVINNGGVDWNMIAFMAALSYLIPACGACCMLAERKSTIVKMTNALLAVAIALFNIVHAFLELPTENTAQYIIMPMLIVVSLLLAWHSIKFVKET